MIPDRKTRRTEISPEVPVVVVPKPVKARPELDEWLLKVDKQLEEKPVG